MTATKHRPFESYSENYLKTIQEILLTKICTNQDNEIASLDNQEFFANIFEMIDAELHKKELENESCPLRESFDRRPEHAFDAD
jgi:hypothetical protein